MKRWMVSTLIAAACLGAASGTAAPSRGLDLFFIDVEGGAATLMVTPAGESVLVDAGWPRADARDAKRIEGVARYVAGLKQIDHFVCTHWHTDHYGDIEQLAQRIPVKRFWDRGIPAQASDGARDFPTLIAAYKRANGGRSTAVKPGDEIPLKDTGLPVSLRVVSANGKVIGEGSEDLPATCSRHPKGPVEDESDNKLSVGTLLKAGDFRFLNLGDLTWAIEHKLVCPTNRVGRLDVWQVSHHGWEASGNPAILEMMKPRVAVMVNGARKGASASVVRSIKAAPSVEALYQLHTNVTTGVDDNTSAERIVNTDEKCSGEFLRITLSPDGKQYTVFKGANKPLQTFRVR